MPNQRTSTGLYWWRFALLFVLSAGCLFGHNPISSWATAKLYADRIELHVELSTESAWLFLGETLDTPPNIEGSVPRLRAKASEVYQLSVNGEILRPRESTADLHEDDGVSIQLIFSRPKGGPLHFEASYLKLLASDHRATLTILREDETILGGQIFKNGKSTLDFELPPSLPSIPPTTAASPPAPTQAAPRSAVSSWEFFKLGVEHILTGYDHLLFLLGLLVACRRLSSMAVIITCFTLAHSLTLALAALDIVAVPSRVVEPLIAASIVFVGLENLVRRDEPRRRWLLTLVFGLVHGFGFASVLREIGLGSGGASIFIPLFSFNCGVEVGQLLVVAVAMPVLWLLRRRFTYSHFAEPAISVVVLTLGAYWLLQRTVL